MLSCLAVLFIVSVPRAEAFGTAANGTTTADFLNFGIGARAVAMGGAYGAVTDDAASAYWNPAGLVEIQHRSVTVMHAAYLGSSYFDYAAYGQSLGKYGAFGVSAQYFSAGSIAKTDASGASLGDLMPYDLAITAAYAYELRGTSWAWLDGFSLGATAKYIESKIATTASTEAVDLGVRLPSYLQGRLRLAASIANLGEAMKFDQTNENLPTSGRLSLAYLIQQPWLTSFDIVFPHGGAVFVGFGTEYMLLQDATWTFAGRMGFNTQTLQGVVGFIGPSLGFGCGYKGGGVDYAFIPLGSLGQAHRFSLSYRF